MDDRDRNPLTAYQADIWAAHSLRPELPEFNSCGYQRFTGRLDLDLLQECLHRAVARNDALRLRFDDDDGRPYQWVSDDRPEIEVVDLSGQPDPRAACLSWIERSFHRPFPLRRSRLFDLGLLKESDTVSYAYLNAHHLVTDGWGGRLFMRQVLMDYEHVRRTGEPLAVPAPSYLSFVEAAARYAGGAERDADIEFYRAALAGRDPAFFARRARGGAEQTGHHTVSLDRELIDRIRGLGGSTFTFIAAAVASYLSRIHRSEQIVLGVPFLNRRTADERRTVGHFANELPLPVVASGGRTIRELAADIRQTARELRRHERLSRSDLLRAVAAPGTRHLYDVTLSYLNWSKPAPIAGVEQQTVVRTHAHHHDALAITISEIGDDGPVRLDFQYARDVFDADFPAEAMAQHVETLLRNAVHSAQRPLARIPMLAPDERDHLIHGLNATEVEFPRDKTLHGLFEEQVARTPDRLAVATGGGLTYAQLDARANQVARVLRDDGVGRDDRVAVLMQRGTPMLTAILGVLKAGGAYLPIDPGYPAERIRFMLADSRAKVVLVDGDLPAEHQVDGVAVVSLDAVPAGPATPVEAVAGARDLAYVIYTSGSTGRPKGVQVEHRSVVNRLAWMQRRYPIGAGDVLLQKTPISFDVSVWELFWWATAGARLALAPPGAERDPRELLRAVAQHRVSVIHFVPSMLGPLLDLLESSPGLRRQADSLRLVVCSGEALPPHRVDQFNRIFGPGAARLANLYGPTEATVDVSAYDCPDDPRPVGRVPIGRPIDNTRLYVLGPDGQPQPAGAAGELCVGGVAVARGYLDRAELTATKFVADPFVPGGRLYRTGDLARWLSDGNLEYLGRIDGQVKVRGGRVELGEVQARLATFPGVRDAVVVDRTCDQRGTRLVGYYLADAEQDPARLRAHLADGLPEFMVPAFFVRLDRIPLTPNGKLNRAALPDPAATADQAGADPRNEVEAALVAVWSAVLGVPPVGIHQDYFAAGGDSILALQVCAEARRRGLYFTLTDLVAHPTVAQLAARVSTSPPDDEAPGPAPFALVSGVDRGRLAGAQDAFPVTRLQLGLVYHSSEHEGSAVYHDVFRYTIRAPWHPDAFRAAFDKLVARHPVLRSSFDLGGCSEPLQVVHHEAPGGLEIADLRPLDPAAAQAAIQEHITQRRYFRYRFDRPPLYLFRAHVLPSTLDLVFSFHHVILDGWSVASLVRELLQDYLHLAGADIGPVPGTELPSPAWYPREERRTIESEAARRYWRDTLDGAELTQLDGFRQHEPPGDGDLIVRLAPLPDGLETRVRELAQAHRVPAKSVLLAAHCLTLRLFSGTADVVTGLVTHGRPEHAEAGRVAGLFLNTVPLRVGPAPDTWLEMVREVYRREQEGHPYRRYPLHAIQHDRGGVPVLETVFNYVHMHVLAPVFAVPGIELLDFQGLEQTNFKLLVNAVVHPMDGRIVLRVDTDGRSFTPAQTDLLIDTYIRILRQMVADPDGAVDFTFLADPPGEVIASPEPPSDIVRRLARHVARTPAAVAVAAGPERWTYAEFDEITTRIAGHLVELGVRPGDLVGILLDRSPEMIATIYGIAKAGAACVPLDVGYPDERLAAMIELARPVRVVTHQRHAHLVRDPALVLPVDSLMTARAGAGQPALPEIRPESLLYVLFTSGSTGVPKGVAMPHRALDNYQAWQVNAASGAAGGKTLQFAPLSFDVSFQEIYTTISGGGTLQLISEPERRDMAALLRLLDAEGVERVFLPYVALQQLAETADALGVFPRRLRVVISSGEQLRVTAEIRRFIAALPAGAVLENQYGPTETHLVTAYLMSGDPARFPSLPPIGPATSGVELYLLDDRMRPVPRGVVGELYFGGVQLALGYHRQPELTDRRFVANPFGPPDSRLYRTGDLARVLPGGDLVWVARVDTQTKVRGFRVEPLEVEIAIMTLAEDHPGIREAAVVARRRGGVDAFLAAFLVGDPDAVDLREVTKRLRASLPEHLVPSVFTWLPSMPLTPSGKRDDKALRELPLAAAGRSGQPVAPRDRYEQSLVDIVGELLQLPSVGVHDNFFEIGGTSLTAMRLVVVLEARYGTAVPLSAFVSTPTVAGLAELLRTGNASLTFDPLVPIRREGSRPPLFLVHPLGGTVLCYLRLAGHLPADQPVYALQAAGCDPGTEPLRSVPELARSYLDAIRRVQPDGPYSLGGWSFGGIVAYEMARQLRATGTDSVDHLILVDPIVRRPGSAQPVAEDTLLEWFFWELIWLDSSGRPRLEAIPADLATREAKFDFIAERATDAGVLRPGSTRASVRRLFDVFKANWAAILAYHPEVTGQDLTLLRAADPLPPVLRPMHTAAGTLHQDPTNGWGGLTTGRLDVIEVPGNHLVLMEEPHVAGVAQRIAEAL